MRAWRVGDLATGDTTPPVRKIGRLGQCEGCACLADSGVQNMLFNADQFHGVLSCADAVMNRAGGGVVHTVSMVLMARRSSMAL